LENETGKACGAGNHPLEANVRVALGSVEAGLIIKELRARMEISSILVICPKALVAERKWFSEMKRFDEHFTAIDGPLLKHCLEETDLEGE